VQLSDAPYPHLFVTRGAVDLEGVGTLGPGDAARLTDAGGLRVTATEPAESLAWEMYAALAARAIRPRRRSEGESVTACTVNLHPAHPAERG
jgi:hypothetical protein